MTSHSDRRHRAAALPGALALTVALALTASGCDAPDWELSGIEQLPLPGGADLGDDPYEITAEFTDVLSLVPQSAVKVNDVAVGRVTRVNLAEDDWTARVTMRINRGVRLPADAVARLEQSSLLGEKYIQLAAPEPRPDTARPAPGARPAGAAHPVAAPAGPLTDGAHIPVERTNRNPEVEEVFGALSLLLNGGGIAQIKTITTELGRALGGNEPEARSLLRRLNTLVTSLDGNKAAITAALDGVNRLSATLATRRQSISTVLTGLSPGLKALERQRTALLTMLRSLDTLSAVAVTTVDKSKDDVIADLKALTPTLRALADSGRALPDSLQVLLTYPFTDEVLRGVRGDYLNVYLDIAAVPGTEIVPALTPPDENPPPAEDTPPAQDTPPGGNPPQGQGAAPPQGTAQGRSTTPGEGGARRSGTAPLPLPFPSAGRAG
ncbi:MlaD family protein [Streptomyces pyxinae]|uniref:MlaD family protein n=1 Tax=Streptomyces pyxinae TaxID=2970734 RepID=UPI003D179F47